MPIDYFNPLKAFAQAQNKTVQGPAVDTLIDTVHMMFTRGAPTEWDYTGFNKQDYGNPILQQLYGTSRGSAISIPVVVDAMRLLAKYKKTQLSNYDQLAIDLSKAINTVTGLSAPTGSTGNIITYVGQEYGSLVFHIPDLGKKTKSIDQAVQAEMIKRGLNPADYWKVFYRSKQGIDFFRVLPDFIDIVKPPLEAKGYDVSKMIAPAIPAGSKNPLAKRIDALLDGDKVNVKFFPYSKSLVDAIKQWGKRKYDANNKTWVLINPTQDFIKAFISVAQAEQYDTSQLEVILPQLQSQPSPEETETASTEEKSRLRVQNTYTKTGGQWHLGFGFLKSGTPEGDSFKEIIKFAFPVYGDTPDGQRFVDSTTWTYYVKGNYADYRRLHDIFVRYGFDTSEFDKILNELIDQGIVPITGMIGDLDGFQKEYKDAKGRTRKKNNPEAFYQYLENNYEGKIEKGGKIIDFKLYPAQKEGIAFLYGRKSALLGDETGLGKTVQLILAADMRMKHDGGNTVIITVNDIVQQQWIDEIKRFAKADDSEISTDPTHGRKWTVMTYHNFSTVGKRDYNVKVIQNMVKEGKIQCCLLDEVDSVKNMNSKRTENVQSLTEFQDKDPKTEQPTGPTYHIPFVWGASATIVANRPVDVFNQLKAINHPLGRMPFGKFAIEFGGMVKGRYGLEPASIEEQIKAANKLKEWLINYEVYIQRTKKDVREDMPEHTVSEEDIKVDNRKVYADAAERIKNYKDPNLPISAMIAMRASLADAKVTGTVSKLEATLKSGKKVGVFTMFRSSLFTLVQGLQKIINQTGGGQVGVISGNMKKQAKDEVIRQVKDPNSDMRAIVIMITAGGTGLDFPNVTDTVRVNDFDWTPRSAEQSEGRFFRIISDDDVNTIYSIAHGTEDEEFYTRVSDKRKIAAIVQTLTQKQMEMITKGIRRNNPERKKVEQELAAAIKSQIAQEEGDETFMAKKAREIRQKMEESQEQTGTTEASNWFKRIK